MSEDSKAIKYLTNQWEDFKEATKEEHQTNVKYPFLYYSMRIGILAPVLFLLYAQYGFFFGIDLLYTIMFDFLYNYGTYWTTGVYGLFFITAISFFTVFFLAFEIFSASFYILLNANFDRAKKRYEKEFGFIAFFVIIFMIPVIFSNFGIGFNNDGEDFNNPLEETASTLKNLFIEIKCSLNTQCILEKNREKKAEQSDQTEYKIVFTTPDKTDFELQDIKEGEPTIRFNYQVQAKGGDMVLDRLECYQGSKIEENKLFDTLPLDSREIRNNELTRLSGITCDLSKLKDISKAEKITIKPVLYYKLKTEYEIKIPIINTEELGGLEYEDEQYFIKKYKDTKASVSNNIFKEGISSDPIFPFFYPLEDYINEISINLKLENNKESSLGTLKKSTIGTKPIIPSILIQKNELEIPYEISAFEDETNIEFLFEKNLNLDNTKTEIVEFIIVEIDSEIRREKDLVSITITDRAGKAAEIKAQEEVIKEQLEEPTIELETP